MTTMEQVHAYGCLCSSCCLGVTVAADFDSGPETEKHIAQVQVFMERALSNLAHRTKVHDQSKLQYPEKPIFDHMTPKLARCTYGSDLYKEFLAEMKPALDNHYHMNSHHPEHWPNGIMDMSLMDIIEMLCDWKAATMRHNDGSLIKSIEINQKRFGYSDELGQLLINTAKELGLFA